MQVFTAVAGNGSHVFVSAAGEGDDDDVVFVHGFGFFQYACHCVG